MLGKQASETPYLTLHMNTSAALRSLIACCTTKSGTCGLTPSLFVLALPLAIQSELSAKSTRVCAFFNANEHAQC